LFVRVYTTESQDSNLEFKIDVYAYALTMFFVLYKEKPWGELNSNDITEKVLRGERPQFPQLSSHKKKANLLKSIIISGWQHDGKERPSFQSIMESLSQ
jgi:hypothetical protein